MAKYPSIKDIDYEVHEFGEINGALQRGDNTKTCEWFAGLYAQTIDIAYTYNVRRIFNWGQNIEGIFHPWTRLIDCLVTMEGGERVQVVKDAEKKLQYGAVAAWKDGSLHVLVYSHHHNLKQMIDNRQHRPDNRRETHCRNIFMVS
ncbi:hypothetical protein ES708_17973 [subsurface metagenome]